MLIPRQSGVHAEAIAGILPWLAMTVENRRYPRIAFGDAGAVDTDGGRVDVSVRDLSCEGAGIEVDNDTVQPGTVVTLSFVVPEGTVSLSARVVWSAGGRAGLRLRLAESDAEARKTFGAWIAPRTKQALKASDPSE